MNKLEKQKLAEISSVLLERQRLLWHEINQVLTAEGEPTLGDIRGQGHDRGDESVADMLSDINISAITAETQELRDIEQALFRINNGGYGTCIDCGDPIATDRLAAYATAKRCLDCQTKHENYRGGKDVTPSL